jgi:hypothetical protein
VKAPDCGHGEEEQEPIRSHADGTNGNGKVGKLPCAPRRSRFQQRLSFPRSVQRKSNESNSRVEHAQTDSSDPNRDANVSAHVEEDVELDEQGHLDDAQSRRPQDYSDVDFLLTVR